MANKGEYRWKEVDQKKSRLFQRVDEPIRLATTSWILGFSILFSWTLMLYRYLNLNNGGSTFGHPTRLLPTRPDQNWRYRFPCLVYLRWPWCVRFPILPLYCRRSSAGITSWWNRVILCVFAPSATSTGSKRPLLGRRTRPSRRSLIYQARPWICWIFGPISCDNPQLWDRQHTKPTCNT